MCKALRRTESNSSSVQVKYTLIYHLQSRSPLPCIYKFRLAASFEKILQSPEELCRAGRNFFSFFFFSARFVISL